MKLTELKEIGLSNGEIKVYKAILEIGIGGLSKIQEKTGIERRNIYDILNKLIEKGLASYTIEKGKKNYQCTHPNKISEEIKKRQEKLTKLQNKIPDIKDLFNVSKPEVRAEVYRGVEGIKTLLNEILDYKECYFMGGNSFENFKNVPKSLPLWFEAWMKERAKKKVIMYDLVSHGMHLKGLEPNKKKKHEKMFYKYKPLPKGMYTPMVTAIFGNKVAQILWEEQPFAFVLESKKVKESHMKYFWHFWGKN
jgi:sugar-specific transcriptional regulator TrmB